MTWNLKLSFSRHSCHCVESLCNKTQNCGFGISMYFLIFSLYHLLFKTIAMSVKRLQELGFKESDCIKALQATSGRLEASATWLLENATPVTQAQSSQQGSAQGWQFAGFEVGGLLLLGFRYILHSLPKVRVLQQAQTPRHKQLYLTCTRTYPTYFFFTLAFLHFFNFCSSPIQRQLLLLS